MKPELIAAKTLDSMGSIPLMRELYGAQDFTHNEFGVITFQFECSKKATHAKIAYNEDGLYDIKLLFINPKRKVVRTVFESYDIAQADLVDVFEEACRAPTKH